MKTVGNTSPTIHTSVFTLFGITLPTSITASGPHFPPYPEKYTTDLL